jgi:sulfate transport system substrate-binding protein
LGKGRFEIVVPVLSILAEPPVAVVDKNAERHRTRAVALAYLEFLYGAEGQEIAARTYYRPRDEKVAARYAARFPKLELATIDAGFGGWQKAMRSTSRTAACSTRSTCRGAEVRARGRRRPGPPPTAGSQ